MFINFLNTSANIANDFPTDCPALEDTVIANQALIPTLLLIIPFHLANIISIATNKRLRQNDYILLLNLSVSDMLGIICLVFLDVAGVPGMSIIILRSD